jgi:alpha-D-xyloside xylohydrolase
MFGPSLMVCPVTDYMVHRPPESSVLIAPEFFRTKEGKPGLNASYCKDNKYKTPGTEKIDSNINVFWYTGRPDYVSDSMYAIRWEGKLVPGETGKYQFHMKCFDAKRIILDGDTLPIVYTSVEQYTGFVNLKAGQEYDLVVETENNSTGAARMQLFWKTPGIFAKEQVKEAKEKLREVYLPAGAGWVDFWTGKTFRGGQRMKFDAPVDKIPLLVKAGSIIPMGPFVQYSTEKPADPVELRIYTGADGTFTLYEDENDNYNYEKGIYATISFTWNDARKEMTIGERKGEFPGMLKRRTFKIVLVKEQHGQGINITEKPDKVVSYDGRQQVIAL